MICDRPPYRHDSGRSNSIQIAQQDDEIRASRFRTCPKCNLPGLIHQEGCDICTSCGYSKCA